jgi:hypothetical protein
MKEINIYNESNTPQDQQKFKGWYWDADSRQFYRWDNQPKEK